MRRLIYIVTILAIAGLAYCADVVLGKFADLTFSGSGTTFIGSFGGGGGGGPVAWWKMTATGTNATQILDFANSYNASNQPSVATGPTLVTTNGTFYSFDGSDDRFEAGDYLDMGTNDYTMSCWITTTSAGVMSPMSKAKQSSGDRWWLTINNVAGKARVGIDTGGGPIYADSTNSVTDGAWHHICATYNRDGLAIIYIDGVHDGSADISSLDGDALTNIQRFQLGAFRNSSDTAPALLFNGNIDDARVYFSALTPTQITNLYTTGRQ